MRRLLAGPLLLALAVTVIARPAPTSAEVMLADWFSMPEHARMAYAAGFQEGSAGRYGCPGRPPTPNDLAQATERVLKEGRESRVAAAMRIAVGRLGCVEMPPPSSLPRS